ncbi:MAG: biotin transporter BioY [Candidatus Caldarchaeum sp.]|nr:biotin transporter BioY [Candidatus Caldarchaeum sp.]
MRSQELALSVVFATLTAVGSQITIPTQPIPFTLQTFFIILTGLIGGPKIGFIATALYLLMGAVGIPVFANLRGGWTVFLGPTAGYLFAFPIAATLCGYVYRRTGLGRIRGALAGAALAEAVIYLIGVPWLAAWLSFSRGLSTIDSLSAAVSAGMLPFLIWDALKALAAVYIATRVQVVQATARYVGAS